MSPLNFFCTILAVFLISTTYKIGVESLDLVNVAVQASALIAKPLVNKWVESLLNMGVENVDHTISEGFAYLSDRLEKSTKQTLNQMKKLHLKNSYDRNKEQLYSLMHSIQQEHKRAFNNIYNASLNLDESVIREYSESVKGFKDNILEDNIKEIAGLTNSYLGNYAKSIQNQLKEMCDIDVSPQWILLNETLKIAFTYVQAAQITETAIIYLDNNKNTTRSDTESKLNYLSLERRLQSLKNDAKMFIKLLPNTMWRCDPKKHILNGTYTEIQAASTKLIAYGIAKYELCPDGELTDCRQLPKNFEFCVSDHSSSETISYINWKGTKNYHNYKMKEDCNGRRIIQSNPKLLGLGQIWKHDLAFEWCDCEKESSYNQICLEAVHADIDYVVTGVKFTTIERIIYLHIQQGKLIENGTIDESTVHWKKVERCKPLNLFSISVGTGVVLGEIDIPDQVLVGLKISPRLVNNHSIFSLAVIMKPSLRNFTNPKEFEKDKKNALKFLQARDDYYPNAKKYNYKVWDEPTLNEKISKRPIIMTSGTPSILTKEKSHYVNAKEMSIVKFKRSDFDSDLGQRIIPMIDIQKVEPKTHVPLTGAALYLKSNNKSSGFIGLKIYRLNLKYVIDEMIPDQILDN